LNGQSVAISKILKQLPIYVLMNQNTSLYADISPVGCNSLIGSTGIWNIALKGSFFTGHAKQDLEPPFAVGPFPFSTGQSDRNLQFCVSSTTLNSLAWVMFEKRDLSTVINADEIPPSSPLQLKTDNLIMDQIAPKLPTIYPNNTMFLIIEDSSFVPGSDRPVLDILDNGIDLTLTTTVIFFVQSKTQAQPTCKKKLIRIPLFAQYLF